MSSKPKKSRRDRSLSRDRTDRDHSDRKDRDYDRRSRHDERDDKEKKRSRSSRSRSHERSKHSNRDKKDRDAKDRDHDREREKDKDRRRSRSPESSRHKRSKDDKDDKKTHESKKEKQPVIQSAPSSVKTVEDLEREKEAAREAEQAALDEEMRKRRERVKAWQDEKKKRIAEEAGATASTANESSSTAVTSTMESRNLDSAGIELGVDGEESAYEDNYDASDEQRPGGWTLEDDDDDDIDETGVSSVPPAVDDDEDDYMNPALLESPLRPPPVIFPHSQTPDGDEDEDNGGNFTKSKSGTGGFFERIAHKRERSLSWSAKAPGSQPAASTVKPHMTSPLSVGSGIQSSSSSEKVVEMHRAVNEISSLENSLLKNSSASNIPAAVSEGRVAGSARPAGSVAPAGTIPMELSGNFGTDAEDEEDPLDAFMSSLYASGDAEQQQELPSLLVPLKSKSGASALLSSSSSPSSSSAASSSSSSAFARGSVRSTGGMSTSTAPSSSTPRLNPFGSNVITLEEILHSSVGDDQESSGGRISRQSSGWESDAAATSGGEDDADDEEEERARQEFIAALRARNRQVDTAESVSTADSEVSAMEVDSSAAAAAAGSKKKGGGTGGSGSEQALGRVFAGEGDMIDEAEVEDKKKSALEILEEAKRGKELKPVDHSTIDYMPFRKNLYIVPRALARLGVADIKEKREDLQIKVRGMGCPVPVDNWEQCGLSERILQVIEKHNLATPFSIQKQAIPAIMCGRDVIGVAKTGSGKTLAFLLPMFRHILDQPPLKDTEGPIGLVMAPARELAFQIFNEAKKFTKALGLRVACIYGGAGVAEQIADLKRGAEIVVCTPGRMIDILCMQAGKMVTMKRVTMVVMDEADRMFDMGFEPQINMIIQNVRPDRQVVLFSATFPKQIEKLAKKILTLPLEIVVGERSTVNKDITQIVEVHDEEDKFMRLLQLLGVWYEKGSVLVFVDKQEKCDQLFQDLLRSGYPCLSLHGGKDQLDRDHTLHEFKTGIKTVMIATSVAGRGLDVPDIVVVINYNCPNHLEDYVHRVGRTGRAGRKGTAYTFISTSEDQYSPLMMKALKNADQEPPPELVALCDGFKEKVNRGEAKWIDNSGFVGKGFSFDASEMNESQKMASMQRRAYDIEQGLVAEKGDDMDGADEDDADFDGATEKKESAASFAQAALAGLPPVGGAGSAVGGGAGSAQQAVAAPTVTLNSLQESPSFLAMTPMEQALERAKFLAAQMTINKSLPGAAALLQPAAAPVAVAPAGPVDANAALARAKLIAIQMASKTGGGVGAGVVGGEAGGAGAEAVAHFSEDVEINDYPHQARKKVTQRSALDELTDRTGVAIISRGSFVAPGKTPAPGERKLYLLVEGSSEMQVKFARMEIIRALEEETLRMGVSSSFGRYSVT